MTHNSDSILSNPLDAGTSVDESVEGVNRRLDEIGRLLETQLATDGVTDIEDSRYTPTAFEYAAVPPENHHRIGLPAGSTVIDFERGEVVHDQIGHIMDIRDFDEMSEGIESRVQNLKSAWMYTDVPIEARFDDGNWFPVDSCQYTPIQAQGFSSIEVKHPFIPFSFFCVASTRSQPFSNSDSVSIHMDREGDYSGTPDSWTPVPFQPHEMYEEHGNEHGSPWLHTVSFTRNTLTVQNEGNSDIYARVMAGDTHTSAKRDKWFEIARATDGSGNLDPIAPGDHHTFHVEEQHHLLRLDVQNATDGNAVETYQSMSARN